MSKKIKVNQTIILTLGESEYVLSIDDARHVFESLREIFEPSPKIQTLEEDTQSNDKWWEQLKELQSINEEQKNDLVTIPTQNPKDTKFPKLVWYIKR
jgi:aspartyl/asparaginyl beta-hydroxylase (cupin superfamily)